MPQSAKDAFTAAIADARGVADNTSATQPGVDNAVTALADATNAFNNAVIQTVADTKFNKNMVFDCQRQYDSGSYIFTAGNLQAPFDADVYDPEVGPVTIPELTADDPAYLPGAYITLNIATGIDNDTITSVALVLKDGANTFIRTISADGVLQYLGAEGFIYISVNGPPGGFGYFFASSEHEYGDVVHYTVTVVTVTKLSELTTAW